MMSPSHRTESGSGADRLDCEAVWRENARWLRTVIASRLAERGAVDDVLQQVALATADPKARPADPARIGPWLYRVAVRQCLLHRRTAGRRRRFVERLAEQLPVGHHDTVESPLDWLLREERLFLAAAAIEQLPELDRQLLLLKHTENWSYQQLADHLGVSLNTVEYRLLKARDRLRRTLIQTGVVDAIP